MLSDVADKIVKAHLTIAGRIILFQQPLSTETIKINIQSGKTLVLEQFQYFVRY